MVYKYSEFVSEALVNKFDQSVLDSTINLNNSKEFRDRGITVTEVPVEKSDKNNRSLSGPIADVLDRSIDFIKATWKDSKCPIKVFSVSYDEYNHMRINSFGIKQISKNEFVCSLGNIRYHSSESDRTRRTTNDNPKTSVEVISSIKSEIIRTYDIQKQIDKLRKDDIDKKRKDEEERQKAFKKVDNQFILDQFSGAFDLCDRHSIGQISPGVDFIDIMLFFKTEPDKKSETHNVASYYGDRYPSSKSFHTYFGKMDSKMGDILLELSEVSSRLNDMNIETFITFNEEGVLVKLDVRKIK